MGLKSLSASDEIIPNRGALYSIGKNGIAKKKVSPVSLSNGMTWSVKNDIMYYIDSLTNQVVAYDYNIVDGSISKILIFSFALILIEIIINFIIIEILSFRCQQLTNESFLI